MARSKTGEAISACGRSPSSRKQLRRFIRAAEKAQDLGRWRRGRAVLGTIELNIGEGVGKRGKARAAATVTVTIAAGTHTKSDYPCARQVGRFLG